MRILLIEDDLFFQKFYAVKLAEVGYTTDLASNGEEGLAKARQQKPDLILLDLIMPVMDGFKVLEELAKDENLKTVPVMVFSTLGQEQDMQRAKSLGAKDYMNKTFFDFDNLKTKIETLINLAASKVQQTMNAGQ